MKKLITVSILVCLTIVLVYATALAQSDFEFNPFRAQDGEIYNVSPGDNIIMDGGWAACRRGAVQMFLTASNIHWTLYKEGSVFASDTDTSQYWGPLYEIPAVLPSACMGNPPEMVWSTRWRYSLGYLEPGEYELEFYWWLDHPVTDVADYDGDGRPDIFEGVFKDAVFYIIVE
jgi:hypothetical protein